MFLFDSGKHRCTGRTVISCLLPQIISVSRTLTLTWACGRTWEGSVTGPGCLTPQAAHGIAWRGAWRPGESFVSSPELLRALQGLPCALWGCSSSDPRSMTSALQPPVMGAERVSLRRLTPWEPLRKSAA